MYFERYAPWTQKQSCGSRGFPGLHAQDLLPHKQKNGNLRYTLRNQATSLFASSTDPDRNWLQTFLCLRDRREAARVPLKNLLRRKRLDSITSLCSHTDPQRCKAGLEHMGSGVESEVQLQCQCCRASFNVVDWNQAEARATPARPGSKHSAVLGASLFGGKVDESFIVLDNSGVRRGPAEQQTAGVLSTAWPTALRSSQFSP